MTPKPLSSRPLDLLYVVFFVLHLIITLTIDILPLWPASTQTLPVIKDVYNALKSVSYDYMTKSKDPFALASWGLVQHEWEFYFMKIFLYMELVIQIPAFILGTYGLHKNKPTFYPLILCYATAALVTTTTVLFVAINLPSADDPSLDASSKFYALTHQARWTILGPLIPFLAIPAVMWVDMFIRVMDLVSVGAYKKTVAERAGRKKKEL